MLLCLALDFILEALDDFLVLFSLLLQLVSLLDFLLKDFLELLIFLFDVLLVGEL